MKKSFTLVIVMLFFISVKIVAQCPDDIKVDNITQPTCGSSNGQFSVLLSNTDSAVEVSIDGGVTFSTAAASAGSITFKDLLPNLYHIVVKLASSTTPCQSFNFVLRANYGSAYTVASTAASNCTANGSIVIGGGVLSTDSVSWLSSLTPAFVTAGSLTANTIPDLAPGLYYVIFKSSTGGNYCYSVDTISVNNTGTACPAAVFCGNATDPTNLFPDGTFGSGGNANGDNAQINGPALPAGITEYTYQPLGVLAPEDGFYAIVNNTAPDPASSSARVFNNSWYSGYDHDYAVTGVMNGYQMVVNASVDPDIVIQETINNLCPHKKYQFSAFIRDLDSTVGQIPANLTFLVNGIGLYTTGNILTGQGNIWRQIGFTFQPTGDSATISIRNNQGGGAGNDWAIDDIYLGDCVPTVALQPILDSCTNPPTQATAIITDGSQFYDTYQWQVNKNDGNGFVDDSTVQTATFNSANSYTASINLPDLSINPTLYMGWEYRIIVGTTASDLTSPTCSYTSTQRLLLQGCDVILPIKVTSIKAQLDNGNGEVLWQVADQINVNHYELQKSTDGKTFSDVISIAPVAGNVASYTAEDNSLSGGTTYYRIKEVDNNNVVSYSTVVTLNEDGSADNIKIFPNPVSGQLFITTPSNIKIESAVIIDATGRKVLQTGSLNNSTNSIEVSSLATGFYTLRLTTSSNEVVNKSFIKK